MLKTKLENQIEDEGGFTLVELLVVILIIGILAAIAIPIFMNQRKTSNDAAVESDVKNLATEIETGLVSNPNATTVELGTGEGEAFTEGVVEETRNYTVKVSEGEGEFTLSDGVTVSVTVTGESGLVANGYTIEGWHSNGKQYTGSGEGTEGGTPLTFNSAKGGLISDSEDSGDEG